MSDLNQLPQPAPGCTPPNLDPQANDAFRLRFGTATRDAVATGAVQHSANADLANYPNGLGTYSKGLLQASYGVPQAASFDQFLKACGVKPGGPVGDFEHPGIVLGGGSYAKQNGPRGAFALQPVGQDSAAFGDAVVPTPPALNSVHYAVELVELYWASLLRDVPFTLYAENATAQAAALELSALSAAHPGAYTGPLSNGKVTPELLFRGGFNAQPGFFAGENTGPYLSQFCLVPTSVGRVPLDQRIRTLAPGLDFMTTLANWYNVQNGGAPRESPAFDATTRYMRSGRDTCAYTQVDELYQAYFIAYLTAGSLGIAKNPTNPYTATAKEKAFGTFGGPDIAATLGAVARAAINAVWYQKWRIHLRHRPEAGGGIVQLLDMGGQLNAAITASLANFDIVRGSAALNLSRMRNGSSLLSQAFPEGSPTHPAYPTGHGTVAGACITVLKFFLDGKASFPHSVQPSADGLSLEAWPGSADLDVNGELHKLAHNVSFGHGIHAGIHWRSDTDYSILLGEEVAIRYLEDQMYAYHENFNVKITRLDGTTHSFKNH